MAFKFVAILATLATVSAASLWPSTNLNQWQQQQSMAIQQGPSNSVSTNWRWDENMDRQQQDVNQQMDHQQRQWNEERDRDWDRDNRNSQWDNERNWENQRNWDNNQRDMDGQRRWDNQRNWDSRRNWDDWRSSNNRQNWNRDWDRNDDRSEDDFDSHPRYEFGYEVRDRLSGDFKAHRESRDGDLVRGQYSMVESDGSRRIVDYTSDGERGFNANVRREGWSRHD